MENCANHPRNSAVEHCEVCGRALCGLCLWYGDDGRRLCQEHASQQQDVGLEIYPPETYAEAIDAPRGSSDELARGGDDQPIPYRGNSQDLNALLAAVLGLTTLLSCFGGAYCLPIAAVVLGLMAYVNASQSVEPARTRKLAAVGLGLGGVWLLFIVVVAFLLIGFLAFSMLTSNSGP